MIGEYSQYRYLSDLLTRVNVCILSESRYGGSREGDGVFTRRISYRHIKIKCVIISNVIVNQV